MINYVYQITNVINNKIYVGVKTNSTHIDDGYFGSGKILKRAINKYGINSFYKEILWHGSKEFCFDKEREIVNEEFVTRNDTYNIALGGQGGDLGELVNRQKSETLKGHKHSQETKDKIRDKAIDRQSSRKGVVLSDEIKKKISETRILNKSSVGKKNPMSKKYKFISPTGVESIVEGQFKQFCTDNNISWQTMYNMVKYNKYPKSGKCVGWQVFELS